MPEAGATGGVKLGFVADVHLDRAFTWAGPEVGRRLRQAIRDALRNAVATAAEVGVDAFCVAGDLFEDDRYAPDTPEFLRGLEHLAFGEGGERGLVIAAVAAEGLVTSQRHVLARAGMYDVNVDADGCGTVDEIRGRLEAALAELPQGAPVRVARVTVTGQAAGPLHISREDLVTVPHGLDKLVFQRLELQAADDLEQIAAEPTVRGAFVRMVREAAQLDPDDRELVLTAGLRALSGRGDLQVV